MIICKNGFLTRKRIWIFFQRGTNKKKKGEKEYLYLMDYKADCGLGNQDS